MQAALHLVSACPIVIDEFTRAKLLSQENRIAFTAVEIRS
jgi:hypothetical protein